MTVQAATALEFRLRQMLPCLTLLAAGLIDLAPIPSAAPQVPAPDLLTAAVFYWSLYRPELVPAPALFLVALASDLVAGSLIGLTPGTLLVMRELVVRQHRLLLGMAPPVLCASFASSAALIGLARYAIASAYGGQWQASVPAISAVFLTVLAWPLVVMALNRIRTVMPKVRHAAGS